MAKVAANAAAIAVAIAVTIAVDSEISRLRENVNILPSVLVAFRLVIEISVRKATLAWRLIARFST